MQLSGKLKPATVSVPLGLGVVAPVPPVLPQAAATKTSAARADRNLTEPRLRCIELFSFPPLGFPIQPQPWLDSSIYAVLNAVAPRAAGARWSLIPRGTSSRSRTDSETSVAIASTATSTAPPNNFV